MKDVDEQIKIIKRGIVELIGEQELRDKLEAHGNLRVKFGADPTSPDLHLGHTVVLQKLKQFQDLGHTIVFIIGDFTARIGDPSGRNVTRPPLSAEQVEQNSLTYKTQIFKILDPEKTEIVYNSQWLSKMNFLDVLKLSAKYTVARMLERDDFAKRYSEQKPISIHEFLYPLMQAYDSVEIDSDIEIGGSDQKFNLLVGRTLQREYGRPPQCILTMPILEGLDGVKKMSKSYDNYIGITDAPDEMFGKIMSVSDDLMWRYYLLLTDTAPAEIERMRSDSNEGKANPMDFKKKLGKYLVSLYWDEGKADAAQQQFEDVFSKKNIPSNILSIKYTELDKKNLMSAIVKSLFASSNAAAKRLIREGAVEINGEKVYDVSLEFTENKEYIIKIGKKNFFKITP